MQPTWGVTSGFVTGAVSRMVSRQIGVPIRLRPRSTAMPPVLLRTQSASIMEVLANGGGDLRAAGRPIVAAPPGEPGAAGGAPTGREEGTCLLVVFEATLQIHRGQTGYVSEHQSYFCRGLNEIQKVGLFLAT